MNIYFKPATVADVQKAFQFAYGGNAAPHTYYEQCIQHLSEMRDAFRGGRRALRFLQRKPGESADQWDARCKLFQNVPLIKHIVNGRSALAYGTSPTRTFKVKDEVPVYDDYGNKTYPDSSDIDEWFGDIYEYSGQANLFRKMIIPASFRDTESTIKLIVTEGEEQPYRLCYLPKQNVCYVMDPEDTFACLGVIECRKLGKEYRSTLTTLDSVMEIDERWQAKGGIEDNPVPGTIPYVPFSPYPMPEDFGNPLEDAILDQKHLINVRSQFALGFRAQTFSQLFVSGVLKGQTYTGADGKERTYFSPESVIEGENGATAQFLNPGFPLTEASEIEKTWLKTTLESYGVSAFRVDASTAPEQPMAMLLRMQPSMDLRQEDIQSFEGSEDMLARLLIAYARVDGFINYDADDIDFCVEYPTSVIPMDQQGERDRDLSAVQSGLMLREDYVSKWIMEKDASAEDIAEYLAKLDAERDRAMQARQAALPPSRVPGAAAVSLLDRLNGTGAANVTAQPGPPTTLAGGNTLSGTAAVASGSTSATPGGSSGGGSRRFTDGSPS